MDYVPDKNRYDGRMLYRHCGNSGLMLPCISLGLWHNFGEITPFDVQQSLLRTAFDCGITHFDLANNYGPPYGEAEKNFGRHMENDWKPFRDELIISTKAGYDMWPGPYGDGGSRKYLISSIDQSLKRMHLEYVDIFYHHRPDPNTPMEETASALDQIVRSGKALYIGLSNYAPEEARRMTHILEKLGTPCLIEQSRYNLLDRSIENGMLQLLAEKKIGCIVFIPLAQGLLTGKYLNGIPADSRAAKDPRYLKASGIKEEQLSKIRMLNDIAVNRGQKLSQMALAWCLREQVVTSAIIGASKPEQIIENVQSLGKLEFSAEELSAIDSIVK